MDRREFHLRAVTCGQPEGTFGRRADLDAGRVGVGQGDRQAPRGDGGDRPIAEPLQDPLEDLLPLPGIVAPIGPLQLVTRGDRHVRLLPIQLLRFRPLELDREARERDTAIEPRKTRAAPRPRGCRR